MAVAPAEGALDPEPSEDRKLLPRCLTNIDGKPARRKPVILAARNPTEIAGPLKQHELVLIIVPVQGVVQPKSGELCGLDQQVRDAEIRRVETVRPDPDGIRSPILDHRDIDAVLEQEARRKEFDRKRGRCRAPDRLALPVSNLAIGIVVEITQRWRDRRRFHEIARGQSPRSIEHELTGERRAGGRCSLRPVVRRAQSKSWTCCERAEQVAPASGSWSGG